MKKKGGTKEPTTLTRIWKRIHRAVKIESAKSGIPMADLVSSYCEAGLAHRKG